MKFKQRTQLRPVHKPLVPLKQPTISPQEILAHLRARRAQETIDYDVMKRVTARRSSFDKREPGVTEPRWKEKEFDTVVMSISPESIELLAVAAMRHNCCNDADFEIRYSYGSGIGTNIVAKCARCGERFDITDYGNW